MWSPSNLHLQVVLNVPRGCRFSVVSDRQMSSRRNMTAVSRANHHLVAPVHRTVLSRAAKWKMMCHLLWQVHTLAEIPSETYCSSVPPSGFILRFHLHVYLRDIHCPSSSPTPPRVTEHGHNYSSIFHPVSINLSPFLFSAWTVTDSTAVAFFSTDSCMCLTLQSEINAAVRCLEKISAGQCRLANSFSLRITINRMIVWSFIHGRGWEKDS